MRKVIDSNGLQNPIVRAYLAASPANTVVLSDHVAIEAYKGDTLAGIYKSMSILSEFPQQVVMLKGTQTICGLSGRTAGLQKRLIDGAQTREFPVYCQRLMAAKAGNLAFENQILEKGRKATAHIDAMLTDAKALSSTFDLVAKTYDKNELRLLRSGTRLSEPLIRKLIVAVLEVAYILFKEHPNVQRLPSIEDLPELPNTYIFRASLSAYLLALDWIAHGGAKGAKESTLLNDVVDMGVIAYATYFDGLLSEDKRAKRIHKDVCLLLGTVFGCQIVGA